MNKHIANFASQKIEIVNEIIIYPTKDLTSLSQYHNKGGMFIEDLPIWLERNVRTPHIEAKLKAWMIGSVAMDITGFGKYSESIAIVEINGENQSWPFSMIYLREVKNAGN